MSHRIVVHQDEEFTLSFEDTLPYANCHCDVHIWSHSVLKRCASKIHQLQNQYDKDLMALVGHRDRKVHKFLRRIGFEFYKNQWTIKDEQDHIVSVWLKDRKRT